MILNRFSKYPWKKVLKYKQGFQSTQVIKVVTHVITKPSLTKAIVANINI